MCLLISVVTSSISEPVSSMVEFFSFTCSHCANINNKVHEYITRNNIQFSDISINMSDQELPTTMMFYVADDAGLGWQFKQEYFAAIRNGMPAFNSSTLNYVVMQIKTPKLMSLLSDVSERQRIKNKLIMAAGLINKYHIQGTPSFLINNSTLLEGEDIINQLSQR